MPNTIIPAAATGLPQSQNDLTAAFLALIDQPCQVEAVPVTIGNADPVFPAIEAHRQAFAKAEECAEALASCDFRFDSIIKDETEKMEALIRTKPATLEGLAALAEYIGSYPDIEFCEDFFLSALKTLATAARDLAGNVKGSRNV